MKGKVNCTCGWNWNKSDSSKKDLYICHQCGRDNSNNMKNGGWLDNYNDSNAFASPDMVGDGFSNVGRNSSPAWGGQFEEGGIIPIAQKGKKIKYVESKNDPRYRAYQDSLTLSNLTEKQKSFMNKIMKGSNLTQAQLQHLIINETPDFTEKETKARDRLKAVPIKVTPYGYKTKDNIKMSGTWSQWKKPQQQVIVKDNNAHQYKTIHTGEGEGRFEPIQRQPIRAIKNIKPAGLVQDNLNTNPVTIQQPVRMPQYYDVVDTNNQTFGGGETFYKSTDLSDLNELPAEGWSRKTIPHYQNGGDVDLDAMRGMMKSKIGMGNALGHPAIKRMSQAMPKTGMTPEGLGTHYMGSVDNYARTFLQDTGKDQLEYFENPKPSSEDIRFNSPEEAEYFAEHYKEVAPMSTIYNGLQEYQMGGSIPGAVGFTYARTKGIPSEGPYAKKTMPSAQDGKDMHGTPMYAQENYVEGLERSNYDPRLNRMNLGKDYNTWADKDRLKAHENYHAIQHAQGRDNFDIAHNTENRQWAEMQKRPEMMSTDEVWNNFYNRKNIETNIDVNREIQNFPEAQFFPQAAGDIIVNKIVDPAQYNNPSSLEGEAQYYENTGKEFQNGGEMKFYQEGLDFQPKTISKNGGWLDKAQFGKKKFKLKDERLEAIRPSESTNLKKPNFELEQTKLNKTYINQASDRQKEKTRRKTLTQGQREREDYNARNEQTGSVQTPVEESTWDRAKAIASNPLTAFGYAARNESLPTRFQHGERNVLDNAIDWVNPLQGVAALSEIPGEVGRGEYLNAGLSLLDAADLGVYAKGAMKASKPFLQKGAQQLGKIPTSIAPELRQGLRTAGPSMSSSVNNVSKNLEDLTHAKDWAKQYGYELPENLERIAQSDELTNRTVRGMMNRHNTFVRGVSTNWDQLEKVNPEILRHLEGKGFDLSTKEGSKQAAQYMSTHVPIDTGYGRASLNTQVFDRGQDAIYTSNSIPTAEGYTYGQGYITKVKKPTDFSSLDRKDWITKNNPEYYENSLPKGTIYNAESLDKLTPEDLTTFLERGSMNEKEIEKVKNYWEKSKNIHSELHKKNKINELPESILDYKPEHDKIFDKYLDDLTEAKNKIAKDIFHEDYSNKILRTEKTPKSNYAHYLHIGTPGEKILEPIKSWEITPDIWKNKSRAHTNAYSKKLSAMEDGGIIKDDRGQWDHPGEITEIGSNQITMKGVPYPVLGISDTGDTQMMYPEEDYEYDGEKVTEFPMAKNGLRQEQKGLVNLDDLTNFTNYNKPTKGWLNKYN